MNNEILKTKSAKEIQEMDIEPINWIINDMLPEGLALLAGRPKIGKSWLAAQLATDIALGQMAMGYFNTQKCKVLYISLEDNYRRLKDRLNVLMEGKEAPDNLIFLDSSEFYKVHTDGLGLIKQAVDEDEFIDLVIIDTLGNAISKDKRKFGLSFQDEYDFMSGLQSIAMEYQLCIMLVHHTRKMEADSVYDEVVGTSGMTAAPDTLLILKNHPEGHILHITGRDVKEENYLLTQDEDTHKWFIADKRITMASTVERQDILNLFNGDISIELKVQEISDKLNKSRVSVSQLVRKMIQAGEIMQGSKTGFYKLPPLN